MEELQNDVDERKRNAINKLLSENKINTETDESSDQIDNGSKSQQTIQTDEVDNLENNPNIKKTKVGNYTFILKRGKVEDYNNHYNDYVSLLNEINKKHKELMEELKEFAPLSLDTSSNMSGESYVQYYELVNEDTAYRFADLTKKDEVILEVKSPTEVKYAPDRTVNLSSLESPKGTIKPKGTVTIPHGHHIHVKAISKPGFVPKHLEIITGGNVEILNFKKGEDSKDIKITNNTNIYACFKDDLN